MKISFYGLGKIDNSNNADIREVTYSTKINDNYYIETYWGKFNSEHISWHRIIKKSSGFLKNNFAI